MRLLLNLLLAMMIMLSAAGAGISQRPANVDPVTFVADQFACDLKIDGRPSGHITPGQPLTVSLPRKFEYLVECESHELPVKLYARYYLTAPRNGTSEALTPQVTLLPVAVLPNLIKASSAPGMEMTAISTARSAGCKLSTGYHEQLQEGTPAAPSAVRTVTAGSRVKPTTAEPVHCGDTNLVELQGPGWTAWFPNRAFQFSFRGRLIFLYEPSRDLSCCWIG
ncbi:hypothetical protein Q4F19_16245 [Sphingomonas sp. BIUV-7]|uniref:Uncharacterized protein n=1 Tax=Sphingomonas natans TaxID=3063330 RepID=A0ABT8YC70_9SPHN|nr:hypothetical protein [Sphingomonas sp. BIUV-7]MDO6415941.1 hypothetical protein [Sphingomonas sp. BIUV-7]